MCRESDDRLLLRGHRIASEERWTTWTPTSPATVGAPQLGAPLRFSHRHRCRLPLSPTATWVPRTTRGAFSLWPVNLSIRANLPLLSRRWVSGKERSSLGYFISIKFLLGCPNFVLFFLAFWNTFDGPMNGFLYRNSWLRLRKIEKNNISCLYLFISFWVFLV